MAQNQENELQLEEESSGGKGKLIIIIALVVVLLGGGAAAFFLLKPSAAPDASAEQAQSSEPKKAAMTLGDARYVAMPRPFVVNLDAEGRKRLVQIKVQLMVRGEPNETTAKKHIPLLNSALVRVFSMAQFETLATEQGKEKLREDALREVQLELARLEREGVVEEVLFTGFVMQ